MVEYVKQEKQELKNGIQMYSEWYKIFIIKYIDKVEIIVNHKFLSLNRLRVSSDS